MFTLLWLAVGLALGGLYVVYARSKPWRAKRVFGTGLVIAALIYFAFIVRAPSPFLWAVVEGMGAILFGFIGIAGIRGSDWWLVGGWAMHPVWDIGLHYLGPGAAFSPSWYAIACVPFDLLAAVYVAHGALVRTNPSMQRTELILDVKSMRHRQDSHHPETAARGKRGRPPTAVLALRLLFKLSGTVAPALAARFASFLWFRPQRHRPPAREQALLGRAQWIPVPHAGMRIAVYRWGRGPTVMLVHGWSGRGAQLGEFVEPLVGAGCLVVAFDAPAHGRSDGRDTTLPEISDVILELALRFAPVRAVIAHSFGVPCVLFALQRRCFARQVVALSAPATFEGLVEKFSGSLALSPLAAQILREMLVQRFGEHVWTRFSAQNMARDMELPAFVIHDRHDCDIPWQEGEAVARVWPRARFLRTEGLGHRRILRDPEVIDSVVRFLVPGGRAGAAVDLPKEARSEMSR